MRTAKSYSCLRCNFKRGHILIAFSNALNGLNALICQIGIGYEYHFQPILFLVKPYCVNCTVNFFSNTFKSAKFSKILCPPKFSDNSLCNTWVYFLRTIEKATWLDCMDILITWNPHQKFTSSQGYSQGDSSPLKILCPLKLD